MDKIKKPEKNEDLKKLQAEKAASDKKIEEANQRIKEAMEMLKQAEGNTEQAADKKTEPVEEEKIRNTMDFIIEERPGPILEEEKELIPPPIPTPLDEQIDLPKEEEKIIEDIAKEEGKTEGEIKKWVSLAWYKNHLKSGGQKVVEAINSTNRKFLQYLDDRAKYGNKKDAKAETEEKVEEKPKKDFWSKINWWKKEEKEAAEKKIADENKVEDKDTEKKEEKAEAEKINPEKVIENIINNLKPAAYEDLTNAQKAKVLQDLKRRVVDLVKINAETQYSEQLKNRVLNPEDTTKKYVHNGRFAQNVRKIQNYFKKSFTKDIKIKNIEVEVFKDIRNIAEDVIKTDLELLVSNAAKNEVGWHEDKEGKEKTPYVMYLDEALFKGDDLEKVRQFNDAAGRFTQLPYEWGQEKKGKNKKRFDAAEKLYKETRDEVLQIKTLQKIAENGGDMKKAEFSAQIEMLKLDNALKIEQLLKTHPELEQALYEEELQSFANNPDWKDKTRSYAKIGLGKLNTLTGKNMINRLIAVGGFAARMGSKLIPLTGGGLGVGLVVGAATGGIRGWFNAKKDLEKKQLEARHGEIDTATGNVKVEQYKYDKEGNLIRNEKREKDEHGNYTSPEFLTEKVKIEKKLVKVSKAELLTNKLQKLIEEINSPEERLIRRYTKKDGERILSKNIHADERRARQISELITRIDHTEAKIESGQVNFGTGKEALVNQFNLINTLNEALVLKEANSEEGSAELKARIDKLLTRISGKLSKEEAAAKSNFIKWQAAKGAALGAGIASIGYVARYVLEQAGIVGGGSGVKVNHNEIYDNGQPKHVELPDGSKVDYDQDGHPVTVTEPNGNKITLDKEGNVTSHTDPNGKDIKPEKDIAKPNATPEEKQGDGTVDKVGKKAEEVVNDKKSDPNINPEKTQGADKLLENAVVSKGKGIEHAFIKQIEQNPELAKKLGFTGNVEDAKALHKFAQMKAHEVALKTGYTDASGNEIRVKTPGKVAYELGLDENGKLKVTENFNGEKLVHNEDDSLEKELESYEYKKNGGTIEHKGSTKHVEHSKQTHAEHRPRKPKFHEMSDKDKSKFDATHEKINKSFEKQSGEEILDKKGAKSNTVKTGTQTLKMGQDTIHTGGETIKTGTEVIHTGEPTVKATDAPTEYMDPKHPKPINTPDAKPTPAEIKAEEIKAKMASNEAGKGRDVDIDNNTNEEVDQPKKVSNTTKVETVTKTTVQNATETQFKGTPFEKNQYGLTEKQLVEVNKVYSKSVEFADKTVWQDYYKDAYAKKFIDSKTEDDKAVRLLKQLRKVIENPDDKKPLKIKDGLTTRDETVEEYTLRLLVLAAKNKVLDSIKIE